MGGGCFTDMMLHSFTSYHQEHALPMATELRQPHKDDHGAFGAAILRFHEVANLYEVLISG
jgi:hypothetical protein